MLLCSRPDHGGSFRPPGIGAGPTFRAGVEAPDENGDDREAKDAQDARIILPKPAA